MLIYGKIYIYIHHHCISWTTNLQYPYSCIQFLNKLFKVGEVPKHSNIIFYMVTSSRSWSKSPYLLNDLRNFNEIFRKHLLIFIFIIVKVTKKLGFTISLENTFIKKVTGGGQIDFPAFLGLNQYWMMINTFMFEKQFDRKRCLPSSHLKL